MRSLLAGAVLLSACVEAPETTAMAPFVQALRPDNPQSQELFRFAPGDQVQSYDSPGGSFRLHYATAGGNAVPGADADLSGVPDFVEQAGGVYDDVLLHYTAGRGFAAPLSDAAVADNGGDGRFDVYFVDFGGAADGTFQLDACLSAQPERCIGYMVQENDFAGYGYPSTAVANRVLASHELFHAVQASYDIGQSTIIGEGTAVWATESFDPTLGDFEALTTGYFEAPERSLDTPGTGPMDSFSYGAAIFFQYLDERYGPDVIRELWELCQDGADGVADPDWFAVQQTLLADSYGASFAEAFTEFATWNLFTGSRADPTRAYAAAASYAPIAMQSVALPLQSELLRSFHASARYFTAPVQGRTQVAAELVGAAAELADLTLLVAVRDAGGYRDVVRGGPSVVVDSSGGSQVVAVVVNTSTSGPSRRPTLCLGSPEEVTACRLALQPPAPAEPSADDGCAAVSPSLFGLALLVRLVRRRGRRRAGA